ncbi:saccharopine dehydrogenase [Nocardioides rotundus]|uniref:saccharopine dehydrogenase n=1 Tax=Nocardioides rotundus TaxID=1774216 RepID=UPI001CC0AF51|nr:saccharopine dehydrogenase [Nocardioides rotundus]UAL29678.1 saccharopine dehydrogenase [Nocardioides rotundus]
MTHLWIRAEARPTEQRTPIVPADAARLVADGVSVTVEESPYRVFGIEEYVAAGCATAPAGSWVDAPEDAYVVGIKELPDEPAELRHVHIYFAHAFKGQDGAEELLDRFARGGGQLLDVEYLTLEGRRVVAFGRWAGYMGAALAVLAARGSLEAPVTPTDKPTLDGVLAADASPVRALVTGFRGRSGRGAVEALEVAGAEVTGWDVNDTRNLDHDALLAHDVLVNCVVTRVPAEPFVRDQDLAAERRLRVVSDVTNDVTSDLNLIPVNSAVTSWDEPVRRVADDPPLDVIAIDNLPSLLPREASESFSAELTPLIADLDARSGAWVTAVEEFRRHTR